MVVGDGLVASAFAEFRDDDEYVIFASGVSNSQETEASEYQREFDLLKSHLRSDACLVYFSTASIADQSRAHSHYIQHKIDIEAFIAEQASDYVIFRLPIVVGRSRNPHTLTNYLHNAIKEGNPINVYTKAIRYLIDIDDIGTLLPRFLKEKFVRNAVVNVAFDNGIAVPELIGHFEEVIGVKANATLKEVGTRFEIDNQYFLDFLAAINFQLPEDYLLEVIRKYYGNN